ncbi:MAG: polysaccharide pyruvyl transferase family protein [Weeksellaceae bacterium]
MKIKTITCHEVYNYGASLQEYALIAFLRQQGFDASAIHYKPAYLSGHLSLKNISNPVFDRPVVRQLYLLAKLPKRLIALKKKKAFDRFHHKYIPAGSVLYTENDELKKNLPPADAYICGSDQIWNSFFQNGKDPAFYLDFVPDTKKKISYAASFAIDKLSEEVKPLVREKVSRLDAVGVRETSAVRILKELGIENGVQVLDPVFLLDKSHWEQFISPIEEDFVFVYDFDSNPVVKEIALRLKKEKGWKIYTQNQNIDYSDQNFWLEGPEKFLSLVARSKMNLTNSFHSTAFSLIFERQLTVVNRSEKINTRMRDLLGLMGLESHLISSVREFEKLTAIDFENLRPEIQKQIEHSKQFLINSLNQ